jgi:hypothetical protein
MKIINRVFVRVMKIIYGAVPATKAYVSGFLDGYKNARGK